jgi:hypothetical protein
MEKEKFKEEAAKAIDEIFAKIDELEAKTEELKAQNDRAFAEAKEEYEEKIAQLKLKKEDLMLTYRKLQDSTEDDWDDVKLAFSSASESFKDGFSKIASIFKN